MKKVKIMLMSIAVMAVVGGALAFKAKKTIPVCTYDPVLNICPVDSRVTFTEIGKTVLTTDAIHAENGLCPTFLCTVTATTTID